MVASIQYIEEVIAAFDAATEANLRTPARQGNTIVLSPADADEVMITADLHGHRRNFNSIRRLAALDKHPLRHLILQEVCHGGPAYPANGGCMSHTLLEDVARLKAKYPERVHFLLSNHELAELTDYPILKNRRMLNLLFRLGMQEAYGPAAEKVRQAAMPFIRSCPLAVRLPGDVVVCHSAPPSVDIMRFDYSIFDRELAPEDFLEHRAVFDLVWGRDYRAENARAFAKGLRAKVLIHGHEPCPEGFAVPNDVQIILDCCGEKAGYVMLSTREKPTQEQIVKQIKLLD
jgi:hypothetical protein